MSDKMAALVLTVQSAPLYRIKTLHAIVDLAFKPGRRENAAAMDNMKDLLVTNLLPDRKLVAFHNQPLHAKNITDMHKVYWYFEDELKSIYGEFVNALSRASHDSVLHTKMLLVRKLSILNRVACNLGMAARKSFSYYANSEAGSPILSDKCRKFDGTCRTLFIFLREAVV